MDKTYKELRKFYYGNKDSYDVEYQRRLNDYATLETNLYPRLMKRNNFETDQFPLFAVLTISVQSQIQSVLDYSKKIQELAQELPGIAQDQFYQEQLYQSIISTNEIEGIRTTRRELADAAKMLSEKNSNKGKKITKHLSTLRMYQNILSDDFLHITTLNDIRKIYDQLTEGEIEDENQLDGALFKKSYVIISDSQSGNTTHLPPTTEEAITNMLQSWLSFINQPHLPFLAKAFMAHYFFENVHPFYDGNGRTGRFILAKYLSRHLDKFSGLVMSQKINEHKQTYYKAFEITGNYLNRADATLFLIHLLNFLIEGQENIINLLQEKKELLDQYVSWISGDSSLDGCQSYILFLLAQSKLFVNDPREGIEDRDIIKLAKQSSESFSKKQVTESLSILEKNAYIKLINGKPRQHYLLKEV